MVQQMTKGDAMGEAEVSLWLAFWLLDQSKQPTHAKVAIDGAHVRIKSHSQSGRAIPERVVFGISDFLIANGWHAS